jgi:hypothetical protein
MTRYLLIAALISGASYTSAEQLSYSSGANKVQLIELYTSQGCSSCPPADKLLSSTLSSNGLWDKFIPIAFHVDYWNYLGWKDIYSSKQSTDKQKNHYYFGNSNNVYTPQFLVNSQEWRGFFSGNPLPVVKEELVGNLFLKWDKKQQLAYMSFKSKSLDIPDQCHFALLNFDKNVVIGAGENSGLSIAQNFSSLNFLSSTAEVKNHNYHCKVNTQQFTKLLSNNSVVNLQKQAFVGWLTTKSNKNIQATGGWL